MKKFTSLYAAHTISESSIRPNKKINLLRLLGQSFHLSYIHTMAKGPVLLNSDIL